MGDKTKSDLKGFDNLANFEADLGADLERDLMLIEETLRIVEEDDWSDTEDQEVVQPMDVDRAEAAGRH